MFGIFNKGILAAIGAVIVAMVYALKRVFDAREEKAHKAEVHGAATAIVEKVNADSRASSEAAGKASSQLSKEIADVQKQADADRAIVAAGELHDAAAAINAAIHRANGGL